MVDLSFIEFSLVLNSFLFFSFFFLGLAGNNLMGITRSDEASKCFTVVLLLLAFEQLIGAYWFDHAFFLTNDGYIATNAPIMLSVKPLLYLVYLILAYFAVSKLFDDNQIVCNTVKLSFNVFLVIVLTSLLLFFKPIWIKAVCAGISALFLYFFIANLSRSIESSNKLDFLVKSPLRRLRLMLVVTWFIYTFLLLLLQAYELKMNFCLYYLLFIFIDAMLKLTPFYYIFQLKRN